MVTKLSTLLCSLALRYILAKNHMVTKPIDIPDWIPVSYILAKNHMVTKPQIS